MYIRCVFGFHLAVLFENDHVIIIRGGEKYDVTGNKL